VRLDSKWVMGKIAQLDIAVERKKILSAVGGIGRVVKGRIRERRQSVTGYIREGRELAVLSVRRTKEKCAENVLQ